MKARIAGTRLGAFALVVLASAVTVVAPAAATALPYVDPNAVGVIGLCDRTGHPVTSGKLTDRPFVWRAVASNAAPPPYNGAGRTATLFAYQPRIGVTPGEWSGAPLTASAQYTDPAHPMSAATDTDDPLSDFTGNFAPKWDGLIQLRMLVGVPNEPPYTVKYAATDIRVTGDTWTVVRGGNVSCTTGKAVSLETQVGLKTTPTTAATAQAGARASGATSAASAGASAAADAAVPTITAVAGGSGTTPASDDSSSSGVVALAIGVVVVLAAAAGGVTYVRRRRPAVTP